MASEAKEPKQRHRNRQRGQTTIFVLVALAIFMLGFIGFGVDMTNLFFRRQKAQGAADAACQACAMDMLAVYSGGPTPGMVGFPLNGNRIDCDVNPAYPPCQYAALNGYSGSGLVANTESNSVSFTFPGSVPGVTPPDASLAAHPFVTTTITDRARVFFSSLFTPGNGTRDVGASATCGLVQANAPVPIIVLNPVCPHAFELSGSTTVKIVGGPTKSIQVNSGNQTCAAATSSSAVQCGSSGTSGTGPCPGNSLCIDLTKGGPGFDGSNFGVFGAPPDSHLEFHGGTKGRWLSPSTPIADPYALTPAPTRDTSDVGTKTHVPPGDHGCPDHTAGCTFYTNGFYDQPIVVKGETAIFEPGIYYIEPTAYTAANDGLSATYRSSPGAGCVPPPTGPAAADFVVDSNGVVRMSTDAGDGSKGVMFYLSGPGGGAPSPYGSVFFGGNAGKPGGRVIDSFTTSAMNCDGSSPDPALGIPGSVDGNVLLGQCTAGGNYRPYDSSGNVRGILFFQDRRNGFANGQPSMQGGGGLVLSGTLYFHNCKGSDPNGLPCDAAPPAAPPNGYQAFFQLQGTPGGGTYVLGNITTDEFVIAGNGNISMQLDPNPIYHLLKATMLQ